MIALVSILPFIHLDENNFKADQNFANIAKSLKLFEMLSNESKTRVNPTAFTRFFTKGH